MICCRNDSGPIKNATQTAGKFGFPGVCDIPMRTVESFLNFTILDIKPDFIVWLGDNESHDIYMQKKSDHLDSTRHIANILIKNGYGNLGQVYPILGNHEGLPCDGFNFDGDSHHWIINDTSEIWKQWFDKECIFLLS